MLFNKKSIAMACSVLAFTIPSAVYASNLVITNNTDKDSTSILNEGPCSTILGDEGVTHGHSQNNVTESLLKKACIASRPSRRGQPWICRADVYMTNNCSGLRVGQVIIDVNNGIQSAQMVNTDQHKYVITYDPNARFSISISEMSSIKKNLKQWVNELIQLKS